MIERALPWLGRSVCATDLNPVPGRMRQGMTLHLGSLRPRHYEGWVWAARFYRDPFSPRSLHRPLASTEGSVTRNINKTGVRSLGPLSPPSSSERHPDDGCALRFGPVRPPPRSGAYKRKGQRVQVALALCKSG